MSEIKRSNKTKDVRKLTAYDKNSRTHTKEQLHQVVASIEEFGFTNPVILDEENLILAGHLRVRAAIHMEMWRIPCVVIEGLTDQQKRAYVIADNKLAENSQWDEELLENEIKRLADEEYDLLVMGFDQDELDTLLLLDEGDDDGENPYTKKIKTPLYEPKGKKPPLEDLYDDEFTQNLLKEINGSDLPDSEKDFLKLAAGRHTKLDFERIADYYAHSGKETQGLFENNALVIVDFNKAIENGFVQLSQRLSDLYTVQVEDEQTKPEEVTS